MGLLSHRIAIDLGTAYSVVTHQRVEEYWRVASSVAYDREQRRVVAFGEEAKKMYGRCPERYEVILPLRDGVIANFHAAGAYVNHLVQQTSRQGLSLMTEVYLCVPWGATSVELRSYQKGLKRMGRSLRLIREPFAAALGCGFDILAERPVTVVDMGGGTTEVATLAGGYMLQASSLRAGGVSCDHLLAESLLRHQGFELGLSSAEQLKVQHGSVWPVEADYEFEMRGAFRRTGRPEGLSLGTEELRAYLEPHAIRVERHITEHMAKLPSEAQSSLEETGLVLCGGTSLLKGWSERLATRLKIPVRLAPEPLYAVIRGMKEMIRKPRQFRDVIKISEACLR